MSENNPNLSETLDRIAGLLTTKSSIKQKTYRLLIKYFKDIERLCNQIAYHLAEKSQDKDEDIVIGVERKSANEIHFTVAGDTLVFLMHTNIIAYAPDFHYNHTEYVQEDANRKYLGQINVYNFMADSIRFRRVYDPGYLVARILVNHEGRFFVEGEKPMSFLFGNISPVPLSSETLTHLIVLFIQVAIDQDLVIPAFNDIRLISLEQMDVSMSSMAGGNKIGFQMSYEGETR